MSFRRISILVSLLGIFLTPCVLADSCRAVLFAGRSCGTCETLQKQLQATGISWRLVDIDEKEGYLELVALEERLETEAPELPVLLLDGRLIGGKAAIAKALDDVSKVASGAVSPSGDLANTSTTHDAERVAEERFSAYGVGAIAVAGLMDGINPCAFATVIFLFGALMAGNHSRWRMLAVGSSFTAGVFLTYLFIGLGVFHALLACEGFKDVKTWFHMGTVALLAVMAVLFLADGLRMAFRRTEPLLRMPERLRQQTHVTIARGLHTRRWLVGGFVLGMGVSLLELACTGQMYLPTILYMLDHPALRMRAWLWFLLYNGMFIVPLVAVMILCLKGMQSQTLWTALKRHGSTARLGAGMVMGIMAVALWR